jgi:L-lactate dehydrogenase complex protein LldG
MATTSRDIILQRVRAEISSAPEIPQPPVSEVWPCNNPTPAAMADQFVAELTAVKGEVIRCATMQEAQKTLAKLVAEAEWTSIGAMDRPLVREVVADLLQTALHWKMDDWTSHQMGELSLSVITPQALLADTGSCIIACPTGVDRLLCYLPPACVVIARRDQLAEHLPAAWKAIAPQIANPAQRGEYLIVTGPSRTADIEKVLILGVHGPKRLVVLLVEG